MTGGSRRQPDACSDNQPDAIMLKTGYAVSVSVPGFSVACLRTVQSDVEQGGGVFRAVPKIKNNVFFPPTCIEEMNTCVL
jgi:hypothetical protein